MPNSAKACNLVFSRKGGAIPGLAGEPAFGLWQPQPSAAIPVVIAVPHAGRMYPPALLRAMRQPALAAGRLEDRLVDLVGQQVAEATGACLLVAHAPRAMIDLNRSCDDVDWEMVEGGPPPAGQMRLAGHRARSGLGLVPRRLHGTGELWRHRLSAADLAQRQRLVHLPYHAELGAVLAQLRDLWGAVLLIDLHSMPPLERLAGEALAPQIVLGDRFGASCGAGLVQAALRHCEAAGWVAAHNRPYAGGYVLDRHGAAARGVHALQIELCRSAYLDAELRDPGPGFAACVAMMTGLVGRLAEQILAAGQKWPQAAE